MFTRQITCLKFAALLLLALSVVSVAQTSPTPAQRSDKPSGPPDTETEAQYLLRTRGYPKPVPLAQAVEEFNRRVRLTEVGKTQPPLTVEEVLAAIRGWSHNEDPSMPLRMFAVFKNVAKTGTMPKGSFFYFNTGVVSLDGYDVDALQIYLRVGLDKYPDDLVGVPVYSRMVRRQFISSRPEEFLRKLKEKTRNN